MQTNEGDADAELLLHKFKPKKTSFKMIKDAREAGHLDFAGKHLELNGR